MLCLFLGAWSAPAVSRLHAEDPQARHTLRGHDGVVYAVAISPDGTTLASGSEDKTVKVWDLATGKNTATLMGHTEPVQAVAFSPDGKTLASGSVDKTVRLWEVSTGKELARLGHTNVACCVAFSPDGKRLASGAAGKSIELWEAASGRHMAALEARVLALAFSPDGRTLASGDKDHAIELWDVARSAKRATLQGHTDVVRSVAFSPDGRTLASGSWDKTVKLWEVATGKERASLEGHTNIVYAVAFEPYGRTLGSVGGYDPTVKLWQLPTGKTRNALRGHADSVACVAFSQDGKTVASGSYDNTVRIWDVPKLVEKKAHPPPVLSARDLERLWQTLAEQDAERAFAAMNQLGAAPRDAVLNMKGRLRPVAGPTAAQIDAWVAELDSNQFAARLKAREELKKLDELAEPALRRTLAGKPSLEVTRQVEELLARIEGQQTLVLAPELLQAIRALEVLEHIGSPEALHLLETLTKGTEGARLTREARGAVDRLNRRAGQKR